MQVRRGDIYYADLSPVVGSEQGGIRPVLIIQNDVGNRHSPTVICCLLYTSVENSGLLTVAALKQLDLKGKKAVAILSGGNMDVITMSSIVQHGLIQRDRIFSASVLLPDKPGQLALVAQTIADAQEMCIRDRIGSNANAFTAMLMIGVGFKLNIKKDGISHVTVSYTHLDVYKRQPLILPRHWKILSRNRSLWCSVSWQKKRLLRHLLI